MIDPNDCGSPDCVVCKPSRIPQVKQTVFHSPVNIEDFSINSVIALMLIDKDKLVERWGQKGYEERLRLLEERK